MSIGHNDEPIDIFEQDIRHQLDALSVSVLSVGQLKHIIREVVREEIAKCNFKEIHYVPAREQWYGPPQYPWHQQVWCDSNYSKDNEIIG